MFLEVSIGNAIRLINLDTVESIVPTSGAGCTIWFAGDNGSLHINDDYNSIKSVLQQKGHLA